MRTTDRTRLTPRARLLSTAAVALLLPTATPGAQERTTEMARGEVAQPMVEARAAELQWAPLQIPGFAPGLQVAVLHGNPADAGPYTLRLRFPAGYAFPAHWHPMAENLSVISGTFHLGMGERTDPTQLRAYAPGDYLYLPAEQPHFGRVDGETVIQLHGMGPFATTVVETLPATP